MHEELLVKARNVLMLCDPAARARMHPQANSLESQAFNLIGEIDAALSALSAQPDAVALGELAGYWMPNGRHCQDGSFEDGPGSLVMVSEMSQQALESAEKYGAPVYFASPLNEPFGDSEQLPPDAVGGGDVRALRELIDEYWSLAYAEGKEGRTHDTEAGDAQRVSVEIDSAIRHLAARQPVGAEPVAWQWRSRVKGGAWDAWENGRYGSEPAPFMEVEHRALYAAPPAPAAVPVDVVDALRNMMGAFDNAVLRRKMPDPFCEEAIQSGRDALEAYDTTHPQQPAPAAVPGQAEAMAIADEIFSALCAAGEYSGEGCWFSDDEKSEYTRKNQEFQRLLATHPRPAAADRGDA